MLSFLPGPICGSLSFLMLLFNTLLWVPPLFVMTILKITIPFAGWQKICFQINNGIATAWISINTFNQNLTNRTIFDVTGVDQLQMNEWYLVLSNHQSWVDIFILQRVLNRKIPFLKFFLKKELIWVPIMGPLWWALDYPFMKRYSRSYIEKNPHLKGKDIEGPLLATQEADGATLPTPLATV